MRVQNTYKVFITYLYIIMKKTTDSSTLHNSFVSGSQENLQENVTGANSNPTQAPTEWHKSVIVQSSPDEFSASQCYTITRTYTLTDIYRKLSDYEKREKELSSNDLSEYCELKKILLGLDYILHQ